MGEIILQDPAMVPTQFLNRVVLRRIDHDGGEAFAWCMENVASRYQYHVAPEFFDLDGYATSIYSFAKKEDAIAFKLIFS